MREIKRANRERNFLQRSVGRTPEISARETSSDNSSTAEAMPASEVHYDEVSFTIAKMVNNKLKTI